MGGVHAANKIGLPGWGTSSGHRRRRASAVHACSWGRRQSWHGVASAGTHTHAGARVHACALARIHMRARTHNRTHTVNAHLHSRGHARQACAPPALPGSRPDPPQGTAATRGGAQPPPHRPFRAQAPAARRRWLKQRPLPLLLREGWRPLAQGRPWGRRRRRDLPRTPQRGRLGCLGPVSSVEMRKENCLGLVRALSRGSMGWMKRCVGCRPREWSSSPLAALSPFSPTSRTTLVVAFLCDRAATTRPLMPRLDRHTLRTRNMPATRGTTRQNPAARLDRACTRSHAHRCSGGARSAPPPCPWPRR